MMAKKSSTIAQAQAEARAPYADQIRKMARAIEALLAVVEEDRSILLQSYCLCDENLQPRLDTLTDPMAVEALAAFDKPIRLGREALGLTTPTKPAAAPAQSARIVKAYSPRRIEKLRSIGRHPSDYDRE